MGLSDSEIASYARGAGVSGDNVAIAVAIALAESGGNPNSHNALPPDDSYGLWQINMLGSLGPPRRAQFGIQSNAQLYDPATNAKAMAILSNQGTHWTPWSTYTSGKYRVFLARGQAAGGGSSSPSSVQTVGLSVPDLSSFASLAALLANPGTWKRIAIGILGFVLLLIALWQFTGVGKYVKPVAKKAVEVAGTAALA